MCVHGIIWVPGQNGKSVDSPLMFLVGGPGALCIDVEFLAVKLPLALCTCTSNVFYCSHIAITAAPHRIPREHQSTDLLSEQCPCAGLSR